ncbi:GNAT family N-acetyltransferase [Paenibacillus sp.]|uniref:GNAT family N-acetyltransferase n=1 Tax=Paenibacillus sp. TaxID=58172 RepID=UPI0028AFA532|nr:GNAT family N-acetyltransferase [Paenibacillus sp.]
MNISYEVPNYKEYIELRMLAGLNRKEDSVAKLALANSLFSVVIRNDDDKLIGMGRVIGDGACYYQIVDLTVQPSEQGLVEILITEIMKYLTLTAPKDANVILMSELSGIGIYKKLGFELTYPNSMSMSRTL